MSIPMLLTLGAVVPALEKVPITQIIEDGGWTMKVLIGLSVLTTILVFYFLLSLRLNVFLPKRLLLDADEAASTGDAEALREICRHHKSAGADIIAAPASILSEHEDVEYGIVRDTLEDGGARVAGLLWQRIQYLMDIAVVAPMIGLFGTVLGMIEAFVSLKEDFGAVKPIGLANGVSKALLTTAGGLVVGIVAMILFSYFRGRVTLIITQLEESCHGVLHRLYFHPKRMRGKTNTKPESVEK